jgi:hypothetical protein
MEPNGTVLNEWQWSKVKTMLKKYGPAGMADTIGVIITLSSDKKTATKAAEPVSA